MSQQIKKGTEKKNFFMGESLKQAPQTIKSAKSIKNSIRINEERKKKSPNENMSQQNVIKISKVW